MLKQRLQNGQIGTELPDPNIQSEPQVQSPTKEISTENTVELGSDGRYCGFFKRSGILGNKPAVIYDGVTILRAEHVIVRIYFLEGDSCFENIVAARGQDNPSKTLNFHENSNLIQLAFVNNDDSIVIIAFAGRGCYYPHLIRLRDSVPRKQGPISGV